MSTGVYWRASRQPGRLDLLHVRYVFTTSNVVNLTLSITCLILLIIN